MNNLFALGMIPFFFVLSFLGINPTNTENASVDITKSKIEWKAYKVTGEHAGLVNVSSGDVAFTDGALTGGSFTIDMTSISVTDLQGEYQQKLEGHLKSPDFFSTEKFPTAKFEITSVAAKGTPGDYKVVGNLTVKGITEPITFYANVDDSGAEKVITADIKVDRTKYDVRYGSSTFFGSLGDKTIYDEFDLSVSLHVK